MKLLFVQGARKEPTVFIIKDSSIKEESFFVDLNCIISSGFVYNLFTNEEKSEHVSNFKNFKEIEDMNLPDDNAVWNVFMATAIQHIKIILCLNPLADNFSKTIRTFPAFVNNTSIDWFLNWPEPALYELAKREFMCIENLERFALENLKEVLLEPEQDEDLSLENSAVEENMDNSIVNKSNIDNSMEDINDSKEKEEKEEYEKKSELVKLKLVQRKSSMAMRNNESKIKIAEKLSLVFSKSFCELINFNDEYCKQAHRIRAFKS